ncbi:hypothetical protein VNO80_03600 [Phaseolus coccineus]|uniref:DUF4283 domain-containing protein n=1 Tax=Phaseolus coccineus TaxID=3886 RepID=A0AAN9NWC3_PHACN
MRRQHVTRKVWNPKVQQVPTDTTVKRGQPSYALWDTTVKRGQPSYAQVVKNGDACASQEETILDAKTPFFNVTPKFPKWLEGSFVGSLSKVSDIQVVQESFFLEGFNFVRLTYLGEKFILLSSEVEGSMEKFLKENKEWLDSTFDSITPWSNSFMVAEKYVWVRCRGIPLKLWSSQCFELIGALVSSLIKVEEATTSREVLEFARF